MKSYIAKFIYAIWSICICILLSILGYLFPVTSTINKHVLESGEKMFREGVYPDILNTYNSELDNYTDALIINTTSYNGDEPLLEKVFSNYAYLVTGKNHVESLYYSHLDYKSDKSGYSRYWHGYVPFIKFLLLFTNLQGIRQLNSILQTLLFTAILILLAKRNPEYGLAYTVCWISLNPMALQMSIQFSSVYYIYSVASCLLLTIFKFIKNHISFPIFFMIIGIVTSWIDLLTYPIATLGIPIIILFILEDAEDLSKMFYQGILCSFAWGSGYAIMWTLKWILSSIVLGQDIITNAFQAMSFRISNGFGETTWTKWQVIKNNLWHFHHKAYYILITISLIFIFFRKKKRLIAKNFLHTLRLCLLFLLPAAMPFLWYFVLSNHSMIHHWFTFRSLAVSTFALLSMFVKLTEHGAELSNRTGGDFHA